MTDTDANEPRTEEEAHVINARIKRALRWSAVFYTPVVALLLWAFNAPSWLALTALFLVVEFASYPLLARSLDRNTTKQIARIREARTEQPAALPDFE
jgi:hypothetical protein